MLAANCANYDPEEMYKVDLLTGARADPTDQTMAESYVRTALELREISELAFFGRFGGESLRACSGFPSLKTDTVAEQVLGLHRRHGQRIWDVLTNAIKVHSDELLHGALPSSSVLMMAITRGATLAISEVGKRADPVQSLADRESPAPSRGADDGEDNDGDAPDRANRSSPRTKPALELARGIIGELYPNGVPQQSSEPNAILCRRVGERLRAVKQRDVSDDTILRAAGRPQIAQIRQCGICFTCVMRRLEFMRKDFADARRSTGAFAETTSADWRDEHGYTFCLHRRASLHRRVQRTNETLRSDQEWGAPRGEARSPYPRFGRRLARVARTASGDRSKARASCSAGA